MLLLKATYRKRLRGRFSAYEASVVVFPVPANAIILSRSSPESPVLTISFCSGVSLPKMPVFYPQFSAGRKMSIFQLNVSQKWFGVAGFGSQAIVCDEFQWPVADVAVDGLQEEKEFRWHSI